MPSHFDCRVCRKNVSVLTHGHHKVLRHFHCSRHSARDHRLRLETPGWRVLDFHGNQLSEDELERQREKIKKGPFAVRDREHPFAQDLITDEAGVVYTQLPINIRNHFVSFLIHIVVLFSSIIVTGMLPQIPSRVVGWAKAHHFYSHEFKERAVALWAFIRTLEGTFRRVAVAVTDRNSIDATHELSVLGSVVAAAGGLASPRCCFWRVACVCRHLGPKFGK